MKKRLIGIIVLIVIGAGFLVWQRIPEEEQATGREREPAKPEIYREAFEKPINAKLDLEKHKAVYQRIKKMVTIPVFMPISDEYYLMNVSTAKTLGGYDTGSFSTTYKTKNGKEVEYGAHFGDPPSGPDVFPETITLKKGSVAYFLLTYDQKDEKPLYLFWFGYGQTLQSKELSKEELTNFANSLVELR